MNGYHARAVVVALAALALVSVAAGCGPHADEVCRHVVDALHRHAARCNPGTLDDRAGWLAIESEL